MFEMGRRYEMSKTCLNGKKVLMFGPKFFGYREAIAEKIRELGAEVDLYDERPNNGAVCKVMLRYNVPLYRPITRKYYNGVIEHNLTKDYDYVFVIKSENKKMLSLIMGLGAGIMIAASFFSLILPSLERLESSNRSFL